VSRVGHKPELPEQLGKGRAAHNLRKYFPEMTVNDSGLREQCSAAMRRDD